MTPDRIAGVLLIAAAAAGVALMVADCWLDRAFDRADWQPREEQP